MTSVLIRTDMNSTIATGHLMRCLSIAKAFKKSGVEARFVLSDNQATGFLDSNGIEYIVLGSAWYDTEGEQPILTDVLNAEKPDLLMIDSYYVTERYLAQLTQTVKTIYIDDLYSFDYPVTGLICYANYSSDFKYNREYCPLLLGPRYAPLREEFSGLPPKTINKSASKVLIMSGGSDEYHIVSKLLEIFCGYREIEFTAICGKYNGDYELLLEKYKNNDAVRILRNVSNIKDIMMNSDIAIAAGGSTLYELCACGIPTLSYSVADNQLNNVKTFDKDKIIPYAGDLRTGGAVDNIARVFDELLFDVSKRQDMSRRMNECVDGNGAARCVKDIISCFDDVV